MATSGIGSWDPTDGMSWAEALGLLHVPFFSQAPSQEGWLDDCGALLDGHTSSFSFFSLTDSKQRHDRRPISWSWSACLRHVVIVSKADSEVLLSRWDAAPGDYWRAPLPDGPPAAHSILDQIQSARPATQPDAIAHALRAFRRLRDSLPGSPALDATRIFNAFLVGVEGVRQGNLNATQWATCETVGEALDAVAEMRPSVEHDAGIADLARGIRGTRIGELLESLLDREPTTGFQMEPTLLLRHAAGQLYQEAHIQIVRDDRLRLPGLGSEARPNGTAARDIHFTPVPLARGLVEQSFAVLPPERTSSGELNLLDPACGSGVFLQEALRELQRRGFRGKANLRGIDISPVSCAMARFSLNRAAEDARHAGMEVAVRVEQADALQPDSAWGRPDVVLMNPPFASWRGMAQADKDTVARVLHSRGRAVDKAMAFVEQAVESIPAGGVLGSVIPASLFETRAGREWRESLAERTDPVFLGRFRSIGYFRGSTVEPGFAVLRRRGTNQAPASSPITVLVAADGGEDGALRALRRSGAGATARSGTGRLWDLHSVLRGSLSSASWLPQSARALHLIETLRHGGAPTVAELFEVHQGVRTGAKPVFVLSSREVEQELPPPERRFFRPNADTDTIHDGRLWPGQYVFYPYSAAGLLLTSEEQLRSRAPVYYNKWLLPNRERLTERRGIDRDQWWGLTRPRSWQYAPSPKLVTKAFGRAGSFAIDEGGDYVVVQGNGWFWQADRALGGNCVGFFAADLHWAYLAVLNSPVFEAVLSCVCPRVAGGQYELATRFVGNALLPDLADPRLPPQVVRQLVRLGKHIHAGSMPTARVLSEATAAAYRISAFDLGELPNV